LQLLKLKGVPPLCHRFLRDPSFLPLLLAFDRDIAERVRAEGCPCGGRLHRANYLRKPRGTDSPSLEFRTRLSFSCDRDGCRCRSTPPSVRFLGRRVYLGVMVVLITALRQGPSPRGYAVLQERFGVDRRTLSRWQVWWKETFPESRFWRLARARCARVPEPVEYPRSLVELFAAECSRRMAELLRFLSPLGGSERFELQVF
jgi:hypothetical protein